MRPWLRTKLRRKVSRRFEDLDLDLESFSEQHSLHPETIAIRDDLERVFKRFAAFCRDADKTQG